MSPTADSRIFSAKDDRFGAVDYALGDEASASARCTWSSDFAFTMKTTLRKVSWVLALGFALAALVQFAGFVAIPGVPTAALLGGFLAFVVLAFVLGDYSQKP